MPTDESRQPSDPPQPTKRQQRKPKPNKNPFVDCNLNPNAWSCKHHDQLKSTTGGRIGGSEELLAELDKIIEQGGFPDIDFILNFAETLHKDGWNQASLDLIDTIPSIISIDDPSRGFALGQAMRLKGRILDKMDNRALEADMAHALADHFIVFAGRFQQ